MRTILLLIFLFSVSFARADFIWNERCREAYNSVNELNFTKAARLISEEKSTNPGNLVPVFIENQSDFFKTFISEETETLENLKKNTEVRIALIEKSPESKYKRLFIGEMHLQLAIGRLKFEEFLSAVNDVRRANKFLSENQKKYPGFTANLRGLGFIHAIAGTIPKNYQWVTNMLGITGTVQQGLGELETLLNASRKIPELSYLENETVLMLTFLELTLDKKEQNNQKIRLRLASVKNLDRKPLLQFAKAVFHVSLAENDSVIQLLSTRKTDPSAYPLHYLDFMEGTARMNKMDLSADKYFERYIRNYKGRSYVYAAWQRRAWLKLIQNDHKGYKQLMQQCTGDAKAEGLTDEDKQALKDARSSELPNLILLKCRLYFDGGYYTQALSAIAGQPMSAFPTQEDKLELTYRLARIFDKTGNKEKAVYYYLETYNNGKATTFYFSANASLLLAKLYEDAGDKKQALNYYRKTLELRNHDYQNSIDQKAKAGISRLE